MLPFYVRTSALDFLLSLFFHFLLSFNEKKKLHKKLQHACFSGDIEKVESLVFEGADLTYRGLEVYSLVAAAAYGHLEIVRFLLDRGAD